MPERRLSRTLTSLVSERTERQILDLIQYLSEARRLEQQGEFIEAIWCYDTILKDPLIGQDPPTLQAAGLGLGQLLISEVHVSDDSNRIDRLLNRAIKALNLAHRSDPNEPHIALALAEAHGERYRHRQQQADVLAVNLLLDRIGNQTGFEDRIATLRSQIKKPPPALSKQG